MRRAGRRASLTAVRSPRTTWGRGLGALAALLATAASADLFNQRNYLIGERASMMGGAFTAVADDASALWYNPAGLSAIERTSISLSANAYGMLLYKRTELLNEATGATATSTLQQITAVPTTLGFAVSPRRGLTLALGVFAADKVRFVGSQERTDLTFEWPVDGSPLTFSRFSQRVNVDASTTLIGPGVGWHLGRRVSVGASLLVQISASALASTRDFVDPVGAQLALSTSASGTSFGLVPVLGVRWQPHERVSVGFTWSSQTVPLGGTLTYSVSAVASTGFAELATGTARADVRYPHRFALGVAWSPRSGLSLSADGILYAGLRYPVAYEIFNPFTSDGVYEEVLHADGSLGVEARLTDSLALRLGLLTNTSGAPDEVARERVQMFGGTAGVAIRIGGFTTSVGLVFQYGHSGYQTYAREPGFPLSQDRFNVQVMVGGSSRFFGEDYVKPIVDEKRAPMPLGDDAPAFGGQRDPAAAQPPAPATAPTPAPTPAPDAAPTPAPGAVETPTDAAEAPVNGTAPPDAGTP